MSRKTPLTQDELLALPNTKRIKGRLYAIVYYRDANDKEGSLSRRVDTLNELIAAVGELQREVKLITAPWTDPEHARFDKLLDLYRSKHRNAPRWYLDLLANFFGSRCLRSIRYWDLAAFKESREAVKKATGSDRSPTTINREMEWLRAVLLFAVRNGLLQKNPLQSGPRLIEKHRETETRRQRAIPPLEEEACILAQCVRQREHIAPLIIATRDTGLGKKDLLALTWRNVDLVDRLLILPVGRQHFRLVGITARLFEDLRRRWLRSERNPDRKVFGGIKDFKRGYRTACRLVGVPDLRFRDLSKGFAADLAEAGVPLEMATKPAGLIDPETQELDPNLDQRNARKVAEALDALHASRLAEP